MLDPKTRRELRSKAHHLKPVILLGAQGLTAGVHDEIEVALNAHELIKIRVNASNTEERDAMIADICVQHDADLVQKIGHVVVVYRPQGSAA